MTMYCTCAVCQQSPAQPNAVVQGRAEIIPGALINMAPGWTLAHWSAANFNQMLSTEIHDFQQIGHKFRVGASFYLYQGPAPDNMPNQLGLMGLGGQNRYTIDHNVANANLRVYTKTQGNPQEVAVVLGCGGSIAFDGNRAATGAVTNPDNLPILTISN